MSYRKSIAVLWLFIHNFLSVYICLHVFDGVIGVIAICMCVCLCVGDGCRCIVRFAADFRESRLLIMCILKLYLKLALGGGRGRSKNAEIRLRAKNAGESFKSLRFIATHRIRRVYNILYIVCILLFVANIVSCSVYNIVIIL